MHGSKQKSPVRRRNALSSMHQLTLPLSTFEITVSNDRVSCRLEEKLRTAAVIVTHAHCCLTAVGHCYVMLGTIKCVDKSVNSIWNNLKQIYCPTKYRIQHHGCDYMTQITTGKISMNIRTYTYVYTVTYMLNSCPTLNEMLGDTHLRPLENENGNVIDQFHLSLVQCVTRNRCHSKWTTPTDKTT